MRTHFVLGDTLSFGSLQCNAIQTSSGQSTPCCAPDSVQMSLLPAQHLLAMASNMSLASSGSCGCVHVGGRGKGGVVNYFRYLEECRHGYKYEVRRRGQMAGRPRHSNVRGICAQRSTPHPSPSNAMHDAVRHVGRAICVALASLSNSDHIKLYHIT
jgi:hypothetical protein